MCLNVWVKCDKRPLVMLCPGARSIQKTALIILFVFYNVNYKPLTATCIFLRPHSKVRISWPQNAPGTTKFVAYGLSRHALFCMQNLHIAVWVGLQLRKFLCNRSATHTAKCKLTCKFCTRVGQYISHELGKCNLNNESKVWTKKNAMNW